MCEISYCFLPSKTLLLNLYCEAKLQCFHARFDFRFLQQHTGMNSRGKVSIYLFGRFLFKAGESQTVLTTHFLLNGQLDIVPNYKSLMPK